jgi:hypothetical protein
MQTSKAKEERPIPAYVQAAGRRDIELRELPGMTPLWVLDADWKQPKQEAPPQR